jgi:hypothetical protein
MNPTSRARTSLLVLAPAVRADAATTPRRSAWMAMQWRMPATPSILRWTRLATSSTAPR